MGRLRRLVAAFTLAGLAGIVGFGTLAAATVPGKAAPATGSSNDGAGPVDGSKPAPTAVPQQVPFFQPPAQDPFSVGSGRVTTGGS